MIDVVDAFPVFIAAVSFVSFCLVVAAFCFGIGKGESNAERRFKFERQSLKAQGNNILAQCSEQIEAKNAHIQALEDENDTLRAKYIRPRGSNGEFVKQ